MSSPNCLALVRGTFASPMRYPIGNQDFRSLREKGYVYVDKTRHISRAIAEGGDYLFRSRPRRLR